MNSKLRLVTTNICPRKCELCSNKNNNHPPIVTIEEANKYDMVILTGGEPMMYPDNMVKLLDELGGTKVVIYTAYIHDPFQTRRVLFQPNVVGVTFTIHDNKGLDDFHLFDQCVRQVIDKIPFRKLSLHLNIFPSDITQFKAMDFSLWRVKMIDWIVDCPLPSDEDFGIISNPWGGKMS